MPPTARSIWWARVERAAEAGGSTGRKLMTDWAHDMIEVLAAEEVKQELVPGQGWVKIPPERFTPEYIEQETSRLTDELGVELGVGPKP